MDRIRGMQIFSRVVEARSFAGAARNLSIPRSTVSRSVQDLEAWLGVRLLQRTTRKLSLTADGSVYYDHCQRILNELERVDNALSSGTARPRGTLRVDMTSSFARVVVLPAIKTFQARYPDIDLVLTLGDRPVDLIREGVDCVVRAGVPELSALLVARRIGGFEWVTCASPAYLEEHGTPRSLDELERHQAVEFHSGRTGRPLAWRFLLDGEERTITLRGSLAVNDTDAYVTCGLQGLGLIRIASFLAAPHVRAGRLLPVLPQYASPVVPLSLLYPQNRHLSPAVRSFADWIGDVLRNMDKEFTLPLAGPGQPLSPSGA